MACPHHPAAALRERGREGGGEGDERELRRERGFRIVHVCMQKHDKLQQNVKFLRNCSTIKSMCTSIAALLTEAL